MNTKFKLVAYAVLLFLTAWFGRGFFVNYSTATRQPVEAANETPAAATNSAGGLDLSTNTNQVSATNIAVAPTNVAVKPPPAAPPTQQAAQGNMMAYLGAFVGALIGLGLLIAYDVTHYMGGVAVDALLDDKGEGMRDPEYERAEQTWANGQHLEAIQLMRDFLKNHPREQYAALRIAEIYEKDLNNPLAAALEYEEVLKQKLPAERWGWAAVHLCNLYSKLGQQDKTRALLQRIVDEYPKTAAAKKARARLGLPEPEPEPIAKSTGPAGEPGEHRAPEAEEAEPVAEPAEPAEPPPKSNLPPGFRPKE